MQTGSVQTGRAHYRSEPSPSRLPSRSFLFETGGLHMASLSQTFLSRWAELGLQATICAPTGGLSCGGEAWRRRAGSLADSLAAAGGRASRQRLPLQWRFLTQATESSDLILVAASRKSAGSRLLPLGVETCLMAWSSRAPSVGGGRAGRGVSGDGGRCDK